jgi:hypothetical protein
MLLSVYTRHSTSCRFSRDRSRRRCNCPKWAGGQVNGYYFRQSAKTRQWAEAEEVRVKLEEALIKGLPPFGAAVATGSAPPISTPANPPPTTRTGVSEQRESATTQRTLFQNKSALFCTLALATSNVFRASLNSLIFPFSATSRAKKS